MLVWTIISSIELNVKLRRSRDQKRMHDRHINCALFSFTYKQILYVLTNFRKNSQYKIVSEFFEVICELLHADTLAERQMSRHVHF
jgi:hypothetical protein